MLRKFYVGVLATLASAASTAMGQSAQPTTAAMYRTFMVQTTPTERGTIFSIDIDNREYWITAKHLFTGAKHPPYGSYESPTATVAILNPGFEGQQWNTQSFSVIDPGKDIDILILVPPHVLNDGPSPLKAESNIAIGGECTFLGFPFLGGWQAHMDSGKSIWLPYIKHCGISGELNGDARVWVLDGINNPGFSGGPVLMYTGAQQEVFAVISGYLTEPAEVVPAVPIPPNPTGLPKPPATVSAESELHKKEIVNVNSGFIVAFDIQSAVDAIHRHPIGPLRTPQ